MAEHRFARHRSAVRGPYRTVSGNRFLLGSLNRNMSSLDSGRLPTLKFNWGKSPDLDELQKSVAVTIQKDVQMS